MKYYFTNKKRLKSVTDQIIQSNIVGIQSICIICVYFTHRAI